MLFPLAALLPVLFSLPSLTSAAKAEIDAACDPSSVHLDISTLALDMGCVATGYCSNVTNTCQPKGCRRDEHPYGYKNKTEYPPLCLEGFVCPDEMDACTEQVDVGQPCQLDRDDECKPPSNYLDLRSFLNVNGSICLNQVCQYANRTDGETCMIENMSFVAYAKNGSEFADIRSRDNCFKGYYCDGLARTCTKTLAIGKACSADKMCSSYNCDSTGTCATPADTVRTPAIWVYVIVGLGIAILIFGTLGTLFIIHRRSREEYQVRLEQYYTEQVAYRESLFHLGQTRDSLLSLPRNTHVDVARQSLLVPGEAGEGSSPREVQHGFAR